MTGESESMVERVARALFLAEHPEAEWSAGRARMKWFAMATAAIEAMREPSAAIMDVDEWTGGELWRASIDAALSEGQEP